VATAADLQARDFPGFVEVWLADFLYFSEDKVVLSFGVIVTV
jgi:hypothetical protein